MSRAPLDSQSQHEDALDLVDGSNRGDTNSDTPSSKMHGVGGAVNFLPNKLSKKKKKTKHYGGLSGLRQTDGGVSGGTPVKVA